ncbi:hypothetical protein METBIDRAFT_227860 [Metschnikowia bicuspidata var. bicuspidata NRRL YB-4993]|uniref:Uncharacterized protein n=1 Tax=Metschnikowia bicuspidata var. bicuspidata NRRL YB-4993 TaxID=869754 RepID=A0A1A0H2B8_9ASCO|nr:hypothetical protein METBIDRAFT_227860 [Metschnikowia bicuspidata var. bicuspidata NRRL YB-4993]OBA18072.1 hypothetical protein METBIDRAFT_227860 [Metschnikowia bicuspidata var. bicuspidata NRRL YB-4993]
MIFGTFKGLALGSFFSVLVAQTLHQSSPEAIVSNEHNIVGQDSEEYDLSTRDDFDDKSTNPLVQKRRDQWPHMHQEVIPLKYHRANTASYTKAEDDKSSKSNLSSGGILNFIFDDKNEYTFLGLVSGNREEMEEWADIGDLYKEVSDAIEDRFTFASEHEFGHDVDDLVEQAWDDLDLKWKPDNHDKHIAGCVSTMNAIIGRYNEIQIDTLGAHWAGLYRGDQLIEETKRQKQIDGTPVQICRNVNENVTETGLYSSLQYKWSAQEGDILVVVSDEVRLQSRSKTRFLRRIIYIPTQICLMLRR